MGEPTILDKAFHVIMTRLVETGQAPFYTELARPLGLSIGESKRTLHDLFASGIPNTGSRSTGNKSGLVNEGLNRWRSAGSSKEKQCGSMLPVLIAGPPCEWR
jgi:hypothetical protein